LSLGPTGVLVKRRNTSLDGGRRISVVGAEMAGVSGKRKRPASFAVDNGMPCRAIVEGKKRKTKGRAVAKAH
jgi:ribosomal protein L13